MSAEAGGSSGSAARRVRETLERLVVEPDDALLDEIFGADPEFARTLFVSVPGVWKTQLKLMEVLSAYAAGLSPEERAALVGETVASFDGDLAARAVNEFSRMVMAVHSESPELAGELYPEIDRAMSGIDFGKFREAVTGLLDSFTALAARVLADALDNPVVLANLFGIVPPVINSVIELLEGVLEKLELPPEILASAVFNVLSAVEADRLGRVLTMAFEAVGDLHRGNLILGGDEPRFRAVFGDFMKQVLDELDMEAATGAVAALGEDLEVMVGTLVELTARDPETVKHMTRMFAALGNSIWRMLSAALGEMAAWPDEVLSEVGDITAREADLAELGRALDSLVALELRMRENNPELQRKLLTDALVPLNTERLELVIRGAAADLRQAAMANPGIRMALGPEEVGRRVNEVLASFNSGERAASAREYLSRMLAAVDREELHRAFRSVAGPLAKAVLSGAWNLLKRTVARLGGSRR